MGSLRGMSDRVLLRAVIILKVGILLIAGVWWMGFVGYSNGADASESKPIHAAVSSVPHVPGLEETRKQIWFQKWGYIAMARLRIGCEAPGVRLDIVLTETFHPLEAGERIGVTHGRRTFILSDLRQLRNLVHVGDSQQALRFVRLRTSLVTWYLWAGMLQELEVVQIHPSLHLPNFGVTPNFDFKDVGSGFLGGLSAEAYRAGKFQMPAIQRVKGGFLITRWIFATELQANKSTVEKVREFVSRNGDYRRTVLIKMIPPRLPGDTEWRILRFE